MQFPGVDRLRKIRQALFLTDAELEVAHQARLAAMPAEVEAELETRRLAREAEALELRRGCADRLRPYVGHLILVSNFGSVWPEENAARIRDAVLAPVNFGTEVPIGISAVLTSGRSNSNHEQLTETAGALRGSFANVIGDRALLLRPQRESSDFWLLSLARAAEDTARQANVPPAELGCIAAVSALDMYQADISMTPEPGTALKLTNISEEAHFGWETISVPPPVSGA